MSLADDFRNPELRREALRHAILRGHIIGPDLRYVVRAGAVHRAVKRVLELPFVSPALMAEIKALCVQLGAIEVTISGRPLLRGVRARGLADAPALEASRRLVTRSGRPPTPGLRSPYGPNGANVANVVNGPDGEINFDQLLASEGMPGELRPAKLGDVTRVANRAEMAAARMDAAAEAEAILRRYREGESIRKIESATGINRNRIHRVLKALGLAKGAEQ